MARPKDDEKRKTDSKGRGIVHFKLNADHWDYREETGNDYGRDCVAELSENNEWCNHKVEGQIKGTASPQFVGNTVSFPMLVKTIENALGTSTSFILFVADTILHQGRIIRLKGETYIIPLFGEFYLALPPYVHLPKH